MKVYELLNDVEFQSETKFAYYDYEKEQRIEIPQEQASDEEIRYMYVDDEILYIEIEKDSQ